MSEPTPLEIEVEGKVLSLRPSLEAVRAISRLHGGFVVVLRHIADRDFDTLASIVCVGTGTTAKAAVQDLEASIYRHGIEAFVQPLTRFVMMLMNGGRDPGQTEGLPA